MGDGSYFPQHPSNIISADASIADYTGNLKITCQKKAIANYFGTLSFTKKNYIEKVFNDS